MRENPKNQAARNRSKGFWVYCIRGAKESTLKSGISGIQPRTKVYPITFKNIEAVVSEVDLCKFGEKEILGKLEQDTKWTKRSVKLHHNIIVKTSNEKAVIPLKFGTIFRTGKNLKAMLKKSYQRFKTILDQLKGKEEWGVKVYLDKQKFIEEVKAEDKKIRQFEKKKAKAPEGIKWYAEKKIDEIIHKKFGDAVEKYLAKIVQELDSQAEKVVINEPMPTEITDREIVLSSACLIKKETAESFKNNLEKFFKDLKEIGFSAEITGPWPPYNFVEIKK